MRTIVCKFGGSSLADAPQFRRVLALVRASPARRCAVLSAPGTGAGHGEKVTAMLETCWNAREDPAAFEAAVTAVASRFEGIARALAVPAMDSLVRRELARAAAVSRDRMLSRGEYLCATLFSRFSGIPMADAGSLVCFDHNGDLDEDRTLRRFRSLSVGRERLVVPGFYGRDRAGRTVTFPRNGSDISGALAAAGLGAGLYENWTDVPGLMTADPAVVPEARLIPQVSYRQMRALARAGARVLHPACLDPVAQAGIPTRLRSTKDPDSFGTLIDEKVERDAACIVSRADEEGATVSVFGVPEALAREAARKLKIEEIEGRDGCVRMRVGREACGDAVRALHRKLIEGV